MRGSLISLIYKTSKQKCIFGTVTTFPKTVIQSNSVVQVKCKVKNTIIGESQMSAVFEPYLSNDRDLPFSLTYLKIKQRKSKPYSNQEPHGKLNYFKT